MYGQRCESLRGGRERKKKKKKKRGQDFNLALTVWIWKRCSMLPASSLPVWERGALGYSHFHYVLNWADFLPWTRCTHMLGRTHTHTLTLTDIHACAHTNTHSVSTPALVSHSRRDVAHKQEIGELLANSISPFDLKYTKKIYPPKHFSVYFPHCKHFCYYKIWHVILIGRDTPYQTYGLYRGLGSHYGKNANGLS